jgi:hypothetical protein
LEQSGVDKRIILKCILKEYGDRSLTALNWLRTGRVVLSKKKKLKKASVYDCSKFDVELHNMH